MREIKFRAWLKNECVMCEVSNIHFGINCVEVYDPDIELDFSEIDLMQYTGLKDTSNKEIYENDVVKTTSDSKHRGQSPVFIDNGIIQPFGFLECYDGTKFEVIGNIHENPELLE